MLKPPRPHWLTAGGCVFVHDPDRPAALEPVFWRPEVFPGTVIVAPAPQGYDARKPLALAGLAPLIPDRRDGLEHHNILADPDGDHYLWRPDGGSGRCLAVVLPLDDTADLRFEAIGRFLRRLRGRPGGPRPTGLQLTPMRRARLVQLLHALDYRLAGCGPRAIAAALVDKDAASLPAIEWKSSAARRKANRLIRDAQALMNGGYRKLLRGD
ncbi:hypothetical protein GALL_174470 [mine drainage metagenome]|uniref:DUF2285 domain-containing protein n=1 Tax=mine drainage metagenome TaxID=410659 RepID=A0A1J5SKE9_9ZZZZ